jgi:hypothetical protein
VRTRGRAAAEQPIQSTAPPVQQEQPGEGTSTATNTNAPVSPALSPRSHERELELARAALELQLQRNQEQAQQTVHSYRMHQENSQRPSSVLPSFSAVPAGSFPRAPLSVSGVRPIMPSYAVAPVLVFLDANAERNYAQFLGWKFDERKTKTFIENMPNKPIGISDADIFKIAMAKFVDLTCLGAESTGGDLQEQLTISVTGQLEYMKKSKSTAISSWPSFVTRWAIWRKVTLMFYKERAEELEAYWDNLAAMEHVPLARIVSYAGTFVHSARRSPW